MSHRVRPLEFQKSIADELNSVKDRVRNLIGDANWGEEGRYKEVVLRNVIKRFLPSNLSVGTGFIVKYRGGWFESDISRQIDVLIYDNTIPVLFTQGDFVILTPDSVRGIVEVKTKIRNSEIGDIIVKMRKNLALIDRDIFSGIFSYEYDDFQDRHVPQGVKDALKVERAGTGEKRFVKVISLGPDIFIKYWEENEGRLLFPSVMDCHGRDFYNIYRIRGLSFSYFISNLIVQCSPSNLDDMKPFLFPIEGTKEVHRLDTVCVNNVERDNE